jgi:hypothetical protein
VRAKSSIGLLVLMFITSALLFNANLFAGTKSSARAQETLPQAAKPKRISAAELMKLRWIEGTWRGTGDIEKPFYERYHFEDEATLVVESFSDETLSKVTEITRFKLSDESFGNLGDGARWVATAFGDDSVTFEPVARARNSFRWQRESKDSWKAILNWPANQSKPAQQRVYLMERMPSDKR